MALIGFRVVKEKIDGAWIPFDLLVTNERLINEKITAGDEIFLLGYPDAIFDPRNVSPVLRKGVISTVPVQGYSFNATLKVKFGLPDHIDGFLIDAAVSPGSSGSLVVLKTSADHYWARRRYGGKQYEEDTVQTWDRFWIDSNH